MGVPFQPWISNKVVGRQSTQVATPERNQISLRKNEVNTESEEAILEERDV